MVNSDIVDITLEVLSEVMNAPECKNADKISAAKVILDIYKNFSYRNDE